MSGRGGAEGGPNEHRMPVRSWLLSERMPGEGEFEAAVVGSLMQPGVWEVSYRVHLKELPHLVILLRPPDAEALLRPRVQESGFFSSSRTAAPLADSPGSIVPFTSWTPA